MRKYFLEDKNRVRDSKPPVKGQVSLYQNGIEIFHGNNLVVDSGRKLLINTIVESEHFFLFYGEDSDATLPSYEIKDDEIPENVLPIEVADPKAPTGTDVQNWSESNCQANINSDMSVTLTALIYPNVNKPIVIREVGTFIANYKVDNDGKPTSELENPVAFSRIVVDPIPLTSGDPIQVIYKLYF